MNEEQAEPGSPDQSGGDASLAEVSEQAPGSTDEPVESGQNLEASIISSGDESNSGVETRPRQARQKLTPKKRIRAKNLRHPRSSEHLADVRCDGVPGNGCDCGFWSERCETGTVR